jgi:hypothetical protein
VGSRRRRCYCRSLPIPVSEETTMQTVVSLKQVTVKGWALTQEKQQDFAAKTQKVSLKLHIYRVKVFSSLTKNIKRNIKIYVIK